MEDIVEEKIEEEGEALIEDIEKWKEIAKNCDKLEVQIRCKDGDTPCTPLACPKDCSKESG